MIKLTVMAVSILLIAMVLWGCRNGADDTKKKPAAPTVTEPPLPSATLGQTKELQVKLAEEFVILADGNITTGFSWFYCGKETVDGVELKKDDYEARSCGQRVGNMRLECVIFVNDTCDAALCVARVALFGLRLRDDDDFAVLRGLQRGRQASQTRTNNKVCAVNAILRCFRHGYRFPQGMFFVFFDGCVLRQTFVRRVPRLFFVVFPLIFLEIA